MMSGYAQDGYLMAKTNPSAGVVDDDGECCARIWNFSQHQQGGDRTTPKLGMDESGQRPRKAVAEAVAHPSPAVRVMQL
jgi:hypothetical protein